MSVLIIGKLRRAQFLSMNWVFWESSAMLFEGGGVFYKCDKMSLDRLSWLTKMASVFLLLVG